VASRSIQQFGRNRHGPQIGGLCPIGGGWVPIKHNLARAKEAKTGGLCPLGAGAVGHNRHGPPNTMWPALYILLHLPVWPHIDMRRKLGALSPFWKSLSNTMWSATTNMGRKWRVVLLCGEGGWVPIYYIVVWAEVYLRTKWRLDPYMHLAITDMGRKLGDCAPLGRGAGFPCIIQCRSWAEVYLTTKWHLLYPSGRLAKTDMGRKLGLCLFGGTGSPSNTMWPGSRPISVPS